MTRRRLTLPIITTTLAGLVLLVGCSTPSSFAAERTDRVVSINDIGYGSAAGQDLKLNACLPPKRFGLTPAVVLVHGGGFDSGTKDAEGMKTLCALLAEEGIAGFSVDYRLMPKFSYPAQVNDVSTAVRWLRETGQQSRFGVDPTRVGLFGSSAGAIIVSSVGTTGEGSTATGTRVAAVVALSPATDLTAQGLKLGLPTASKMRMVYGYLGCTDITSCPNARPASPLYGVDSTDPAFYIAISDNEVVPVGHGLVMRDALIAADVPVTLDVRKGTKHGLSLLDSTMRADIAHFLTSSLVTKHQP
ncbi:MAG: alpha/beta hydrolase [Microbacteriaceae bacterium]|nr:alpha/beta hydrolase [Microbacteriaceae bacterium]